MRFHAALAWPCATSRWPPEFRKATELPVIIYMLHRPSNVSVLLAFVMLIYTGAFLVLWGWVIWGFSLEWRRRVLMDRYSKRHNLDDVSNHG